VDEFFCHEKAYRKGDGVEFNDYPEMTDFICHV